MSLIDTKESAKILNICTRHVQHLIKHGFLEAEKIGGVWVMDRLQVEWYAKNGTFRAKKVKKMALSEPSLPQDNL